MSVAPVWRSVSRTDIYKGPLVSIDFWQGWLQNAEVIFIACMLNQVQFKILWTIVQDFVFSSALLGGLWEALGIRRHAWSLFEKMQGLRLGWRWQFRWGLEGCISRFSRDCMWSREWVNEWSEWRLHLEVPGRVSSHSRAGSLQLAKLCLSWLG